jgi:hypothetical protein
LASTEFAPAQSLVLLVAEHQKVKEDNPRFLIQDQHPSFGFKIYFNSILNTKRAYRFGVGLSSFSVDGNLKPGYSEPSLPDQWMDYRLTTLSVTFQRKVFSGESVHFLGSLSAGVAFKESEGDVSIYYRRKDHVCFSIQPGACYVVRVYRNLGVQIAGGYNFFTGRKQDIYPFSPGFLVEGGVLLELPIGDP